MILAVLDFVLNQFPAFASSTPEMFISVFESLFTTVDDEALIPYCVLIECFRCIIRSFSLINYAIYNIPTSNSSLKAATLTQLYIAVTLVRLSTVCH